MSKKLFLSQSVLFIKKSKKSGRKHKNRSLNSSDAQMYPDINNEQTPAYLSAIGQFLERRSSAKVSTDELEENMNSPNSHNNTPNKVKFAEEENGNSTDNDNNSIDEEVIERSFSSLSKKISAEDIGESTFSNTKLFHKNNESRTENKNTSSSVNYEKFQTGKFNDSLRKHGTVPSTSFEVSSDSNIQHEQNAKTINRNNLNTSQITARSSLNKKHSSSKMDTTDSNISLLSRTKRSTASLKNTIKMDSNSRTNIDTEPSKLKQKISSLLDKDTVDSNTTTGLTTFKQDLEYHIRSPSLSKEDNERINGCIKYAVRQSAEESSHMEFTSYVPFIPFNELKWRKTSRKADFGWYCEWRKPSWNNMPVLIRRIKSSTMRNSNILISEINSLSSIRHPNILALLGYTYDSGNCLMTIYQYFRHSLYCHLHEMACALSLTKIIKLVLQIAEALSFAHMMGIIHTTISSHCIALSDDFNNAKLFGFDFSVSTNSGSIVENIGRKQWYQWLAPELLDSQSPCNAQVSLDVYSLCVVLWECCYLSMPWKNISFTQLSQVYTKWRMGIPLTNNRYLPTEIYSILKNGFQIDSNQRSISLKEIKHILKETQKQFQNDENIFLFTSIEQLSSEKNLQKVIIKRYITPENIYQQLSTTTTPSPKSISTNASPPENKNDSCKDSEKVDDINTIQRTPKTSKSKLLHNVTDIDKDSLKTSPRKIIIPNINFENIPKLCTKGIATDDNIVNVREQTSHKIKIPTINLENIKNKSNKETEIDVNIIPTINLENIPKFCRKSTAIGEYIVDETQQTSNKIIIPTMHLKNIPNICSKANEVNENILPRSSRKILIPTINKDSESNRTEIDEGLVDDASQQTTSCKNNKMNMKNNSKNAKATDDTLHTSSTIDAPKLNYNKNLNKLFDEAVAKNYDIKTLIYEYEILTKHLHDSVVPSVNFDRTKLYVRNTDIKPASHRTTIIEVPVTANSPKYLLDKKKKKLPSIKFSLIQQQKRLCTNELKNYFEHYLWKKEKKKCLQITDTVPLRKAIENKNHEYEKVKKSKTKLFQLNENDYKIHFIKSIVIEIIDAVLCSEKSIPKIYKTSEFKDTKQDIISYNSKNFLIDCFKQNIKLLKEYEIQQQQICSQMKRILDILNFYINLNNTSSRSWPVVQRILFTEKLTTIDVPETLSECQQFISFKSPNFMNYWQNLLKLYITTQLRDVYIDDDFTSDAVQLSTDLTEFYIFVEDQEDKDE